MLLEVNPTDLRNLKMTVFEIRLSHKTDEPKGSGLKVETWSAFHHMPGDSARFVSTVQLGGGKDG